MLVADDDPAILRLIATILEKENFTVVTARDGREAYKILQSGCGLYCGDSRRRHAAHFRSGAGSLHENGRATENDSGDDDDGRTGSKAFVRQFFRRRGRVFAEAVHDRATTDHVADVGW